MIMDETKVKKRGREEYDRLWSAYPGTGSAAQWCGGHSCPARTRAQDEDWSGDQSRPTAPPAAGSV